MNGVELICGFLVIAGAVVAISMIHLLLLRPSRLERENYRRTAEYLTSQRSWLSQEQGYQRELLTLASKRGAGDPIPELLSMFPQCDAEAQAISEGIGPGQIIQPPASILEDVPSNAFIRTGVELEGFTNIAVVRRDVVFALLAESSDPRTVDAIMLALNHPDARLHRRAAEALGRIGDPRAVPVLIHALGSSDSEVRATGLEALKKIGTDEALAAVEVWRKRRSEE